MIPKKIHYCWFGKKPLPRLVKKCIKSWKKQCPDYEIIRWDESNFDITGCSFAMTAYEAKAWAFVSDYARLEIVYNHGGFYLDTDVELLKTLDSLLGNECYIGVEQSQNLCTTGLGFGAVKSSSTVYAMLAKYNDITFSKEQAVDLACPYLNSKAIEDLGYVHSNYIVRLPSVTVYPCRYFDPIAPGKMSDYLLCDDTLSIHHYGNSWGSTTDRMRRYLVRLIGYKRVEKLKKIFNG